MRCNIFKPISNDTGEFLMFSQYTDDLTKEDPAKGSYRVVPSRFAALDLFLGESIGSTITGGFVGFINSHEPSASISNNTEINKFLAQYLQSYYENSVCIAKEVLGYDDDTKEMYWDEDSNTDGYATQLLWKMLKETNLIHIETKTSDEGTSVETIPELKFVGDINIHSDRHADGMNYNDIYCYISPGDTEYYYELDNITGFEGKTGPVTSFPLRHGSPGNPDYYDYTDAIMGWTQASYPVNNGGVDYLPRTDAGNTYSLNGGYKYPLISGSQHAIPRHSSAVPNSAFTFNCIIVFYDVYCDLDLEEPQLLHYNRPLGIYFTGPASIINDPNDPNHMDTDGLQPFRNQVTKYVSHEDIFGQGTGWSVRLMTRVVATPNASSYAMVVDGGDDYETVAGAMGVIAGAIADIRTDMSLQAENYQLMKDHLAIFKNTRTNVPYVRSILVPGETDPVEFWFVNGRNTGQRVYPV